MIRVLHVINSFGLGGSETQLLQILRNYDRRHFHMDSCTIGSEPGQLADSARTLGARVLECPKSPNLLSFSQRMARLLEGKQYNIVHAHFDAWSGPILRGATLAGVPVRIAHLRSSGAQGMGISNTLLERIGRDIVVRWGRHWIKRYATHIFGVSGAALDARWPGRQSNPQRFTVWTAGVDTQYFSPGSPVTDTDATPKIVCVGNFFLRSKRQDLALRILSLVRNSVPATRLILVGHGTHEKACRELAARLGLTGSVDFLGLRARDEVLNLLRNAPVCLSCSETEGLSNVLLEAQAVGVPVVASDIPANREALAPEMHPYLFKQGSVEDGATNVIRILQNRELRNMLGRAGRQYVQDHYETRRCLSWLESRYRILVGTADGYASR